MGHGGGAAMTSSLTLIALYGLLLATVLLTPYASLCHGARLERHWSPVWTGICAAMMAGALALTIARDGKVLLLCAFLLLPLIGLGTGALIGGMAAILLFVTVTWWTADLQLGPVAGSIFVLLALGAGLLARRGGRPSPDIALRWPVLLCVLIGLGAGLLTAPFESIDPILSAWHHWSAYLSPVEAWRGGGVPYRDFPIQYGLGPTALLKAACGNDCWRGLYWTAISANALYFAVLAGCVLILTIGASRGLRWLGLIALFCACFIWTGYPVQFAGPAMTPSVAGLRFMSIAALLLHILLAEHRDAPRDRVGHGIWLVSLFWSVEAGLFATILWWPYLALRAAGAAQGGRGIMVALLRIVAQGACALAIGVSALVLTLGLVSEGGITATDFFAYVQHPPGTRPVNGTGTIWIALASVALALPLLARQGYSARARPLYACITAFVVAGTYYISRSHNNNILNLFPLLVLLLLAIAANRKDSGDASPGFAGGFVIVTLAAMVAFVATFNFGPWREGIARTGWLTVGPDRLLAHLTPRRGDIPVVTPPDGVAGLDYLRARNAGMVVLFDSRNVMPRGPGGTAWTGVNSIANFAPLPRPMILHYMARGATAYRRPGWILADAAHRDWVRDFQSVYAIGEQHRFGSYTAYYMVPR